MSYCTLPMFTVYHLCEHVCSTAYLIVDSVSMLFSSFIPFFRPPTSPPYPFTSSSHFLFLFFVLFLVFVFVMWFVVFLFSSCFVVVCVVFCVANTFASCSGLVCGDLVRAFIGLFCCVLHAVCLGVQCLSVSLACRRGKSADDSGFGTPN